MNLEKSEKLLKEEIIEMEIDMKLAIRKQCTKEESRDFEQIVKENKLLPKDVYRSSIDGYFYKVSRNNLSDSEITKLGTTAYPEIPCRTRLSDRFMV